MTPFQTLSRRDDRVVEEDSRFLSDLSRIAAVALPIASMPVSAWYEADSKSLWD